MADKLGAKVAFQHTASGKGKLVVAYNSLDELEGILGAHQLGCLGYVDSLTQATLMRSGRRHYNAPAFWMGDGCMCKSKKRAVVHRMRSGSLRDE